MELKPVLLPFRRPSAPSAPSSPSAPSAPSATSPGSSDPPPSPAGTSGRPAARWLVAVLPAFRVERCGWSADDVVALVAELKSATRLVALSPAARAQGLRAGMTASEARALVPEVVLEPWDEAGEEADRAALVRAFERLSDQVAPWGEEGVEVEIGRTSAVFGGDEGVLAEARELVEALGHPARIAIADDPLAAAAIAMTSAEDRVVPPGGGARALADLPMAALRPSEELELALLAIGVERVGAFAKLEAASVAGRFGEEGVRLHRVARGLRSSAGSPPPDLRAPVSVSAVLGGPTSTLEPIGFLLPGLLARLSAELEARDRLAVRVVVRFAVEGRAPVLVRVRVGRPTRGAKRLERVIRARLEAVRLPAPAVEVGLVVEEDAPEKGWQPGLLDRAEGAEAIEDLVARLVDGLGEDAVFATCRAERWRPEAAWSAAPFDPQARLVEGASSASPDPTWGRTRRDPVAIQDRRERDLPVPRPAVLLPRPEPVDVQLEGDRPVRARLERGWEPIARAEGPERLTGEWWKDDGGFDREYWVVEIGGVTGWLFRDVASGRWSWHGWFD